jgi:hypothetical protein
MRGRTPSGWLALAGLLATACVPAPRQDYTVEQIPAIEGLPELMRVMYADLGTTWDLAEQATISPAELEAAATTASRVDAVAETLRVRFAAERGEGFEAYTGQLGAAAQDLRDSAAAGDASAVRRAVRAIGAACEGCHGAYR